DWSSDVCSSDLGRLRARPVGAARRLGHISCRSEAESVLLCRLVAGRGDQPLVQHLLVLAELRDRVLALASALRRLLRLTLRRLLLWLALRGMLLGTLLVAMPPRRDRVDQSARGTGSHAEHGQTCAAAVLPGRLHAARDGLVDEGLRAVARQRVGLLHVGQQLAGALVVLDRDDRGLHERQTAVGGPAVALLDGGRQRL